MCIVKFAYIHLSYNSEFITSYDTLASMGQELKSCMSSLVLGNHLAPVVEENWGKNNLSMWGHVMGRNFALTHQCQISHGLPSIHSGEIGQVRHFQRG
jgi:hypothetical protein